MLFLELTIGGARKGFFGGISDFYTTTPPFGHPFLKKKGNYPPRGARRNGVTEFCCTFAPSF